MLCSVDISIKEQYEKTDGIRKNPQRENQAAMKVLSWYF